jgi:hypothetical protein
MLPKHEKNVKGKKSRKGHDSGRAVTWMHVAYRQNPKEALMQGVIETTAVLTSPNSR